MGQELLFCQLWVCKSKIQFERPSSYLNAIFHRASPQGSLNYNRCQYQGIWGDKALFLYEVSKFCSQIGDLLELNCTSEPSHPPSELSWEMNKRAVDEENVIFRSGLIKYKKQILKIRVETEHYCNIETCSGRRCITGRSYTWHEWAWGSDSPGTTSTGASSRWVKIQILCT